MEDRDVPWINDYLHKLSEGQKMRVPSHRAGCRLCSGGAQGCGAEQGPCCAPGAVCWGRASAAYQAQHSAYRVLTGVLRGEVVVEGVPPAGQERVLLVGVCFLGVLVSIRVELIFLLVAGRVLCFGLG